VAIHGEDIPIVVHDDVKKNLGVLSYMDYRHYDLNCTGVLSWQTILPFLSQVHRFWRPKVFLRSPWPCENK